MKIAPLFAPCLFVLAGAVVHADPIAGLANTGLVSGAVSNSGTDSNWTVAYSASTPPTSGTDGSALIGNQAGGSWLGNNGASQWIGDPSNTESVGYFDYFETFTLANAVLSTVTISGEYAVDNSLVNVFLNGHSLGISDSGGVPNGGTNGYSSWTTFSIPTGDAYFNADGSNVLEFETYNGGGPAGLRVQLNGSYSEVPSVPEASSTVFLLGGALLVLGLGRKKLVQA